MTRTKSYRNILNYPNSERVKPKHGSLDKNDVNRHHSSVLSNIVRFPNSTSQKDTKAKRLERLAATVKTFSNDDFVDDIEGESPHFFGQSNYDEFQKQYPTLTRLLQTNNEKRNSNVSLKGISNIFTVFEKADLSIPYINVLDNIYG